MKKIIRNIALLMAPIALYYCIFLAFEPNNYFGLRSVTPSGAVFGAIRSYEKNPTRAVILGDSRLAHLNMDTVDETTGRDFSNLAFSGASLKESLDELEWLLAHYPDIDEVVFGFSFHTLNARNAADRFHSIETGLYNPFAYLTNLGYNLESLFNLTVWLRGETLFGGEGETQDPATYQYVPFTDPATGETVQLRDKIVAHIGYVDPAMRQWAPNDEQFDRLLAFIDRFEREGKRFIVVFPPMDDAFLEHVMKAYDIDDKMPPYIERLRASGAEVYDYELTGRPDFAEDMFYDGFHLDYRRGLPAWTKLFFGAIATPAGNTPQEAPDA